MQPKVVSNASTATLTVNMSTSRSRKPTEQPIALKTWINGKGGLAEKIQKVVAPTNKQKIAANTTNLRKESSRGRSSSNNSSLGEIAKLGNYQN